MRRINVFISLILMLTLVGCSELSQVLPLRPTPTIDAAAIATIVAEQLESRFTQTAAAFPLPLQEGTQSPPAQPSPEVTFISPDQLAADCLYLPADLIDQPLPDIGSLQWQIGPASGGQWTMLQGFSSPVIDAEPSPGGRWWAVRVLRRHVPAGPAGTALYLIDGIGDDHWQASAEGSADLHQYAWLSDGSLVWIDQEQLWAAGAGGENHRSLNLPEPAFEVFAGSQDRMLVSGSSSLWRQNGSGGWDRVSDLDSLAQEGVSPAFSNSGANVSISPDGTTAALLAAMQAEQSSAQIWLVPLEVGQPVRQVTEFTYLGRGGRISPPVWIAGGNYLYPGQKVGIPGTQLRNDYVFFETTTAERLSPLSMLPPGQNLLNLQVSPDGQWLALVAVPAAEDPVNAQWSIHIFQSGSFIPVAEVTGDTVLAWRSFPAAVWVAEREADVQVVRQVVLPAGDPQTLAEVPVDALPVVIDLPQSTALFGADRIRLFDLQGQIINEHSLPLAFVQTTIRKVGPAGQILMAGVQAVKQDNQCKYAFPIVLWYIQQ